MVANSKAKLKMLYIGMMLEQETDEHHGLTMTQIIEKLNKLGVNAERKGVYRDLELLREFGMDIKTYQRNPVEYAIDNREFDLSELMLLADAVESSRFLTRRQANSLIRKIKSLASVNQRPLLDRRIHVSGRIKSKNDSVFGSIDVLHQAMKDGKKVAFAYMRRGADGKRRATREGKRRIVTPIGISYDDGFYYLTAWSAEREGFAEFRIDRIERLSISTEDADRNEQIAGFSYSDDSYERFGRFDGPEIAVTLAFADDKAEIVMDRFGEHAKIWKENEEGRATTKVRKSPQFFGWIAGLAGEVTIAEPQELVEEYRSYLRGLIGE